MGLGPNTARNAFAALGAFLLSVTLGGCAGLQRPAVGEAEEGLASYYSDSLAGSKTASGEKYDPRAATCAHKKHSFGTLLKVTLLDAGKSVVCRVNDRGPFVRGRVVDLSKSLATELGITERGVARVIVKKVR